MKKRNEISLEELRERLIDVEREIVLIERNYNNITGRVNYMEQRPYNMIGMFTVDVVDSDLDYPAFGPLMTDTDYVDEKLEHLKLEREDLRNQIKLLEKEIEQSQRGS